MLTAEEACLRRFTAAQSVMKIHLTMKLSLASVAWMPHGATLYPDRLDRMSCIVSDRQDAINRKQREHNL